MNDEKWQRKKDTIKALKRAIKTTKRARRSLYKFQSPFCTILCDKFNYRLSETSIIYQCREIKNIYEEAFSSDEALEWGLDMSAEINRLKPLNINTVDDCIVFLGMIVPMIKKLNTEILKSN